jgi:hypothetical protein
MPRLSPAEMYALLELYEERAAIREFDGNQPREQAEVEAWEETLRECAMIPPE